MGLSSGVLIKENHIAAAGGIAQALAGARAVAPHGLRIEIEVRSLKELYKALAAHADAVLLDNFKPSEVRAAVSWIATSAPGTLVEVSGGLDESNIAKFANCKKQTGGQQH